MLPKEETKKIIEDNRIHKSDSGSPEVQIALITNRINQLSNHFETHKNDHNSRRGLLKLVGQRKRLLEYIKKTDVKRYEKLIKKLNLRK
ncbi:MAG: 30S ribosomal protein S15 [Candidatus Aminicenantes bacterium]|nr:30S ribosomal protein S15 [Candidatus Aminicenantes bacterium]